MLFMIYESACYLCCVVLCHLNTLFFNGFEAILLDMLLGILVSSLQCVFDGERDYSIFNKFGGFVVNKNVSIRLEMICEVGFYFLGLLDL